MCALEITFGQTQMLRFEISQSHKVASSLFVPLPPKRKTCPARQRGPFPEALVKLRGVYSRVLCSVALDGLKDFFFFSPQGCG